MNKFPFNQVTTLALSALLAAVVGLASCTQKKDDEEAGPRVIYTNCKVDAPDSNAPVRLGWPRNPLRLKATGTVKTTVIMVDFPDAAATKTPAQAYAMISGATATFTEMSYGRMQYQFTPRLQWYRMSKASNQYTLNTFNGQRSYITEAVQLADADVDFSTTDSLVVLSNPDATGLGEAGPAFVSSPGYGVTADGNEMMNAATSGHDINTWGSIWLNHEVTHTLGLVDLYAAGETTLNGLLKFIGEFSYMGLNSFSNNAPGLTAWERWLLGWIDDSQMLCKNPLVDGEQNITLSALHISGGTKAVVIPLSATAVLVVESRRANGIDANIAKTGVLVYTVDAAIETGHGPIQTYPINSSDPLFLQAPRAVGESVSVGGFTVQVTASDSATDTVRVTAN